ncbi:MAG: RsmB/NOP family class I SAM-dependent RNA methyltransferase [Nitrosarchaeum sp.]|nr:RsmB/NOP family class I SAM-dependent RNA methyltransferase [Nitrosarchaeum sp.]
MTAHFLRRYHDLGYTKDPREAHIRPALRINTLRTKPQDILTRLNHKTVRLQKIPYLTHGYFYEAAFSLGATPEYLQGYYYLQGAASQIPAEILDPKPGETVLDMAAAPGSKTTQIAQAMHNQGILICLDARAQRLLALRNNLERCGATNTIIYRKDARFASDLGMTFDKILLDAPCSGNWAADPVWHEGKTLQGFKDMAKTQRELIKEAWTVLKPGGHLVYSTCSLEPEENEEVIDWFLGKETTATLIPHSIPISTPGLTNVFGAELKPELTNTMRIWPDETEGFFIAHIQKPL